jgi:hypothetical protein
MFSGFKSFIQKSILVMIMILFHRTTQFRIDAQVVLSRVLSALMLRSVEVESVGYFFQVMLRFFAFLRSGCIVGSKDYSFNGWKELILLSFFIPFVELIHYLDEPRLKFFHVFFGEAFLFFFKFQQYIVLNVHHLVASVVLLNFLRNFILSLHCHDSLKFVFYNDFRVLL